MPANEKQALTAVALVLATVQKRVASQEEVSTLTSLIMRRGYSQAELAYAAEELMYDPELDKKLNKWDGNSVSAADFERVIHAHRAMRAKLNMKLTLQDMNELIERYPSQLSVDDFGICGYTAAETPLYRYSFSGKVKDRTPSPQLMLREDTGADRVRTEGDGSAVQIGELI